MQLSKEEQELLSKLRDARISKDVLVLLTKLANKIIENRPLTKIEPK